MNFILKLISNLKNKKKGNFVTINWGNGVEEIPSYDFERRKNNMTEKERQFLKENIRDCSNIPTTVFFGFGRCEKFKGNINSWNVD